MTTTVVYSGTCSDVRYHLCAVDIFGRQWEKRLWNEKYPLQKCGSNSTYPKLYTWLKQCCDVPTDFTHAHPSSLVSPTHCQSYDCANASETTLKHYSDVIISAMASQITGASIVYKTDCSGTDRSKHQSSASLAFAWGIHWWPVNSPHKGPITRTIFQLYDVIMEYSCIIHMNPVSTST